MLKVPNLGATNFDFFIEPRSVLSKEINSLGVKYLYILLVVCNALNDIGKYLRSKRKTVFNVGVN